MTLKVLLAECRVSQLLRFDLKHGLILDNLSLSLRDLGLWLIIIVDIKGIKLFNQIDIILVLRTRDLLGFQEFNLFSGILLFEFTDRDIFHDIELEKWSVFFNLVIVSHTLFLWRVWHILRSAILVVPLFFLNNLLRGSKIIFSWRNLYRLI